MASSEKIHDLLGSLPQTGINKSNSIGKITIKSFPSVRKTLKNRILCKSKSSPNAYVSQLTRKSSRINFEDFWSNRMKAEIRNLETENLSMKKFKKKLICSPKPKNEMSKRFMRNNLESLNVNSTKISTLGLVPAIDKIIDDCKHAIRTSRKLSNEISLRNNILERRLSTYSRIIFS